MEFGNPIVGGEDLIRSAIKSPDFNTDQEGGDVQGWRIAQDGSATFYNLTIGSTNFNIDEDGNAVFQSLTAQDITLNGTNLADTLNALPAGIQAVTSLAGTSARYNGTELVFARLLFPNFRASRQTVIGASNIYVAKSATTIAYVLIRIRINWGSDPGITGTELMRHQIIFPDSNNNSQSITLRHPWTNSGHDGEDLYVNFTFSASTADATTGAFISAQTGSRVYVEDMGPAPDYQTYTMVGGSTPPPPPTQYVKTYSANGSGSYQSDGTNRGVAQVYQGYYSSTNGNGYSIITFPYSTIQSDLSGATINKVELYLDNTHFYSNGGGQAIIGTHNQTSASGNHASSQITDDITRVSFTYGQAKWVTIPNSIGTALKGNTAKGIALGPGPSSSQSYYGYFQGATQTGKPQLRITYTK